MDLTPIFAAAIPEANRRQTATLGDRGSYIGSSDLGCARKASLQRKYPKQQDINKTLKLMRGHAAEFMLDKILQASGVDYDTQVEIIHPQLPLKCHIDFLLYQQDGLHVVEVKSVSTIPDAVYLNFEDQLHFQMGMLRLQYPAGKIGGSILAIDLNAGQVHQFNGYEYDSTFVQKQQPSDSPPLNRPYHPPPNVQRPLATRVLKNVPSASGLCFCPAKLADYV